jgi:hypothetical protein
MNKSTIVNKSTMLFVGGAVLGASLTAFAMMGRTQPATFSGQQTTDQQLQKFAEITENLTVTAGVLKNSAETLASLTLPIALVKDNQRMSQVSQSAAADIQMESVAKPAPLQPTRKQVDQFNNIRDKLSDAANNHGVALGALMQEANALTPEQRQQLTNEAMDMIKRGQLRAEQFIEVPGR